MKEHPVKRLVTFIGALIAIAAFAGSPVALAQEKAAAVVPLKVQLVVSRHAADKKISSLPYTLWVTANAAQMTRVRMGVQVPVPTTVTTKEGVTTPSYSYQNVGMNIDCRAQGPAEGLFSVEITLVDSSLGFDAKESAATLKGVPALRSFTANFNILLKDGQTAQYASATDPLTGETVKVDVTLNVLK
jgi:hypothetical protein